MSQVDLILPEEIYEIVNKEISDALPIYSRVILPLSALLEGEFFNEYIKKGSFGLQTNGLDSCTKLNPR